MYTELINIRSQTAALLAAVDRLISNSQGESPLDVQRYRVAPGGPLSPDGITEMYKRFNRGEPDAVIARAMGVSVQGCQKRRAIWKAGTR
jgi:hypothetical protein